MSHHLNLDFNVLPANKEPTSKKLQKKTTNSAKKKQSRELDIDNKEMEWRLLQLKQAMGKEKEERGKQGYWKSGNKDGALDSHARNILGRSVKSNSSRNSSHSSKKSKKVVVLKDEPLDLPKKESHTKKLISKLMTSDPKLTDLSMNDVDPVTPVNKETWISVAPDRYSDNIMELQSDHDGNLPLQILHGVYPVAIGLFFMRWGRKRLLVGVDGKVMRPKTGWGSEVYFPYNGTTTPRQEVEVTPSPPRFTLKDKPVRKSVEKKEGGLLLKGDFNEDESSHSFQKALQEWRSQSNEADKVAIPPANTPTSLVEMSVHSVQSEPVNIEINFSEYSTLSYMEKLLLKKHRSSDVPPLPDLNYVEQENDEIELTVAEKEERENIRQLFSPLSSNAGSEGTTSTIDNQSTDGCLSGVVIKEVQYDDLGNFGGMESSTVIEEEEGSVCFVEEASDLEEELQTTPSYSGFQIEEIFSSPNPQINSQNSFGNTDEDITPVETLGKSPSPIIEHSDPAEQPQAFVPVLNITPRRPPQAKRSQSALRRNKLIRNKDMTEKRAKTSHGNYAEFAKHDKETEEVSLVSVIGSLPRNPDAIYRRGLGDFFTEPTQGDTYTEAVNDIENKCSDIMLNNKVSWNPASSLVETLPDNYEVQPPTYDPPCAYNVPATPAELVEEELEREEEDAKALDRLEWELASQTGNLTEDGRVSRMVDEWSSDDEELGIINDPGFGSGLSTPEVDQASLGNVMAATPTWQEPDKIHQQNFQDMEQAMMADLSSDGDDEMEYSLF